ncbi:MAG: S41 family peptidase [Phycisphaerales bacterium]|jgi:C-terminal processing protease CtpA/Prc
MNTKKTPNCVTVAVLVVLCSSQAALFASYFDDLVAEEKRNVVAKQDYTLNTDVTVTLKKGQSIQLDCPSNPHDIEKFIIYYYQAPWKDKLEDIIRADAHFEDGHVSGGGSRISSERALRQAGYTMCLMITQWHVDGDTISVEFRASDDLQYNHDIYQRWTSQGLHFSKMYKNRELIPTIEIPEAERIAGFARLWSEVKYNFAFFDQVPQVDWDEILLEYIPKIQAAKSDVAYYRVLRRCIALLKDGHTSVGGPSNEPSCNLPIQVQAVQNQAVIVEVYPVDKIKSDKIRDELLAANLEPGDVITHIDGQSVHQILAEDIYPFISASTAQALDLRAYPKVLLGDYGTKVSLDVFGLDGSKRKVTLTRGRYRFSRKSSDFECKVLKDGIVYVNLPGFGSDHVVKEFDKAFGKIKEAKGLILDVRQNGGGSTNHGYAIVSRLIDKSVPGSHWKSRKYIAAYRAWGRDEQWQEGDHSTIEPHKTKHYGGSVVVLAGPRTGSAAEDFVVAFQTSGRGKVIGQKTCGSTGQPLRIELPGGGGARICTKRDTYPDGREFVGIGVIPDIEIEPTRQDIAEGRDAVLEKALEVLNSKIK